MEDEGAPVLPAALAKRIEAWVSIWTEHCHINWTVWDSREVYAAWGEQATLLCALTNREVIPQGFAVVWARESYPDERGGPSPSTRMTKRRFRHWQRDLTPRQISRIIEESNLVLDRYAEPRIRPLVEPAPVLHNRRPGARR